MIQQLEKFLQDVHHNVMTMINRAQESLRRLDEIALKPNLLSEEQDLELLIESEKNEAKPGWKQRVQYFEEAKRHATILPKVKDAKEAQKEEAQKMICGLPRHVEDIEASKDFTQEVEVTKPRYVRTSSDLQAKYEKAVSGNPLSEEQYLELLIESEKNEAKPGWKQRVQYFEEAKRHAKILSKVMDAKEAKKSMIRGNLRSGERWYC